MQSMIVGAGNLGVNVAFNLLQRGDSVIVTSRDDKRGKKIEEELSSYGNVHLIVGDPGTDAGVIEMFEKATKVAGKIDNLIVTVGGFALDSIKRPTHFSEMLQSHLVVPINILKNFSAYANTSASAVFVSSIQTLFTSSWNATSYLLGKSSLNKLVEIAAAQLLERRIRVNAVAPASIENICSPGRDWHSARTLDKMLTPPEGIAEVIAFLCSPGGECVNGVVIPLDGGDRFGHASD